MPPQRFWSLKEIAGLCGSTKAIIKHLLKRNGVPPAATIGGISGYSSDVAEWVQGQLAARDRRPKDAPELQDVLPPVFEWFGRPVPYELTVPAELAHLPEVRDVIERENEAWRSMRWKREILRQAALCVTDVGPAWTLAEANARRRRIEAASVAVQVNKPVAVLHLGTLEPGLYHLDPANAQELINGGHAVALKP